MAHLNTGRCEALSTSPITGSGRLLGVDYYLPTSIYMCIKNFLNFYVKMSTPLVIREYVSVSKSTLLHSLETQNMRAQLQAVAAYSM